MKLARLIELLGLRLKTVVRVSCGILALLIVLDALFVSKQHAHTAMERFPGFWSIFGFIGCVLIIIISKWYGHAGIMTRENYYEAADPDKPQNQD